MFIRVLKEREGKLKRGRARNPLFFGLHDDFWNIATGLTLGTSALETLYGGQFKLPTHFMIPNNLDIPKSRERVVILYSLWWLCWNKYDEAKKCWNWPLRKIYNITDAHTQGRRKHQYILAYRLFSLHFVSKVKFCGVTDIFTRWARGVECRTRHDTSS